MQELDNEIRESAIDLHEQNFVDIIDHKGDIYRLYHGNKEYEANNGIPPIAIEDAGKMQPYHPTVFWMRLNFDELISNQ